MLLDEIGQQLDRARGVAHLAQHVDQLALHRRVAAIAGLDRAQTVLRLASSGPISTSARETTRSAPARVLRRLTSASLRSCEPTTPLADFSSVRRSSTMPSSGRAATLASTSLIERVMFSISLGTLGSLGYLPEVSTSAGGASGKKSNVTIRAPVSRLVLLSWARMPCCTSSRASLPPPYWL